MIRTCVLSLALCFAGSSLATTWIHQEVEDPMAPGEKCRVQTPGSFGSYIYGWPSKYDQVFWPMVEEPGLWFCEKSGFTAFIGDFDGLIDSEREAIRAYLAEHYSGSADLRTKLELLEGVYQRRKKDDHFRNVLSRVLARWYQDLEEYEKANDYRRRALGQIREQLAEDLPDHVRLEYLYIACNYGVFLEGADPADCTRQVREALEAIQDEELAGYVEYLSELLEETARIKPGQKIDPAQG